MHLAFAGLQRSPGSIHTLNAPLFESRFFPEPYILRAVIYLKNCRYRAAGESVGQLLKIYLPLYRKPQRLKVDDEHWVYSFAGAYWQDERGYYRFVVRNRCSLRAR